jgi:hypothetical protein
MVSQERLGAALVAYLLAGTLYNRRVRGARGLEALPHIALARQALHALTCGRCCSSAAAGSAAEADYGELKQEELVADAMALMSKMNLGGMMGGANGAPNANMMKNMMSMFGGMAPPRAPRKGREGREDVRARLQKKMAARAPNQADDSSFTE